MTHTSRTSRATCSAPFTSPAGTLMVAGIYLLGAAAACTASHPSTPVAQIRASSDGGGTAAPDPAQATSMSDGQASGARRVQQTATTQTFVQQHYLDSVDIREAIVAASLVDMRRSASAVANDAWTPRLRDDYAPFVTALRERAREVAAAESLRQGVTALGQMGVACADCHRKFGGPGSSLPPEPLQGVEPAMVEHAAATDALWQGLVGPSDEIWRAGAQTLLDAPAPDTDAPDVVAAARHLRELAQQALTATVDGRPEVLGHVLLTCAACHENLGVDLPRPALAH